MTVLAFQAVAQNGDALQWASSELRRDREFILKAVLANGLAPQHSEGLVYHLPSLVHRIAAFAFAMAIPRCQWRHRCVVTLGESLVVLYRKPLWQQENESKGRKAMRAMSKSLHGDVAKPGEPSQWWHYKIGEITCVARNLRCASLRFALQRCGELSALLLNEVSKKKVHSSGKSKRGLRRQLGQKWPFRGNFCSSPVAVGCGGICPNQPRKGPIFQG